VELGDGFHPPDVVRWQEVRWTDGRGVITFDPRAAGSNHLDLWIGRFVEPGEVRELSVVADGRVVRTIDIERPRTKAGLLEPLRVRIDFEASGSESAHVIELMSDARRPGDGSSDRRLLGVPLVGVTTGGARSPILGRASLLTADVLDTSWLATYDDVVANSAFTARWVREWWGIDPVVLEPPVALRSGGSKLQVILGVGRFFAPERGHSKKQLELVGMFRRLIESGLRGWELHLVGGCAPEDHDYLESVRSAAEGLPVQVHVDASGAELDSLYSSASIFWHAAGLDEDLEVDPVRAEHFGITTVEAMSAGVVPVVYAAGGQPEIVREGVDGRVFTDRDEWATATMALVDDPDLRREMGAAARERARDFGRSRFADRIRELLLRSGVAR
jgi:hypothetical protein